MNLLKNGCRYSDFNFFPDNWNTTRASLKKTWRIEYRFYDPEFKEKYSKGYPKVIKAGLNRLMILEDRQQLMRELLAVERDLLENQGYNPILNIKESQAANEEISQLVDSKTPFIQALEMGLDLKVMDPESKKDIKNKLPHVKAAADAIKLNGVLLSNMPISSIRRKHIRLLFNKIGDNKGEKWTANNYNRYRTDLRIIFSELNELEAMDVNPLDGIKKRKAITKEREVLSEAERTLVNNHLQDKYPTFWRFLHIFFHSGARETELLNVERKHVNLDKGTFEVAIKKGDSCRTEFRAININALTLWKEIVEEADELPAGGKEEKLYLFSEDLAPSWRAKPIRQEQISRRWKFHVKDKLGITADFYPLKHLNTTETVGNEFEKALNTAREKAAKQNGHTTTAMVRNIYDIKSKDRELEIKKKINNKFA